MSVAINGNTPPRAQHIKYHLTTPRTAAAMQIIPGDHLVFESK